MLAGWLAIAPANRLLRWTKADAEILRSDVYRQVTGSGGRRQESWRAAVTIRFVANGQFVTTSMDRGFESAIRSWMEHWARGYPAWSRRTVLFNPANPWEADLFGEWGLTSFAEPLKFAVVAVSAWWCSRRLGRAAYVR